MERWRSVDMQENWALKGSHLTNRVSGWIGPGCKGPVHPESALRCARRMDKSQGPGWRGWILSVQQWSAVAPYPASGAFYSPPLSSPHTGEGPGLPDGVAPTPHCSVVPGNEGHLPVLATVPPPCDGFPGDEPPAAPQSHGGPPLSGSWWQEGWWSSEGPPGETGRGHVQGLKGPEEEPAGNLRSGRSGTGRWRGGGGGGGGGEALSLHAASPAASSRRVPSGWTGKFCLELPVLRTEDCGHRGTGSSD